MKSLNHNPLKNYSEQLVDLFQQALTKPDPALFLYKKNARTPLFMAESIARLLAKIYEDKEFELALKSFKKTEDLLGDVDYYDQLQKHFSKNRSVKKTERDYLITKRTKALKKLNDKLYKKKFYQEEFNEVSALKVNLNNATLIGKLRKQMILELKHSHDFFMNFPVKFTDLEQQVHEIRRHLRWISIYGQSLQGLIVLKKGPKSYEWEKDLVPKSASKSPYNKVFVKSGWSTHITLDQKAFYALNFVVDELGVIKDKGLAIEALTKSIKKTGTGESKDPTKEALRQLKVKYNEDDLLKEAHDLLKSFFSTYKIHETLFSA